MSTFIILLRAIGPVTHRIMSMSDWRLASEAAGFGRVETYLATGNMLVDAEGTLPQVTRRMAAVVAACGLPNAVIVRRPAALRRLVAANPFPETAAERPAEIGVYFFAGRPRLDWVDGYDGPERCAVIDRHLIVDFPAGFAGSPRLAAQVERRSGLATARNWNTLVGLAERSARHARQA